MDPSPTEGSAAPQVLDEEQVEYCYGHPKTPTKLHCSRCERPICGRCAIPASVGQHCPECVAEARRTTPRVRSAIRATAPAVTTILAINIGMFILQQLAPEVTARLLLVPQAVDAGQWWRLLTPMVLHAGFLHIFLNSYVLYIFGPNVEQAFGTVRFIALYVVSGFMGSVLSYVIPPDNPSLGASGAIFGLAGVLFVYLYRRRRSTFIREYLRSITIFIVANLIIGFVLSAFIDNWAHLGGLVAGALLAFGFDAKRETTPLLVQIGTVGAVIALGVYLVMARTSGALF
ncbi:MAG: rhomboid family intramembrane serine protease [Actinomycetota bacterium]